MEEYREVTCPQCGRAHPEEQLFCEGCGILMVALHRPPEPETPEDPQPQEVPKEPEAPEVQEEPKEQEEPQKSKKRRNWFIRLPRKYIVLGAAGLILLLAVAMGLIWYFGRSDRNDYALYYKGDELYLVNVNDPEPRLITNDYPPGGKVVLNADGSRIFYLEDGQELYCLSLKSKNAEPVLLDEEVRSFYVNEQGDRVTYQTEEGTVYQHNLKNRRRIVEFSQALDYSLGLVIGQYHVSSDGLRVCYYLEGTLHLWNDGEDMIVAEQILSLAHYAAADDLRILYYKDEANSLYRWRPEGGSERIGENVSRYQVYESGEVYYLVSRAPLPMQGFLKDSLRDSDAAMEEPKQENYESLAAYMEACEVYAHKQARDALRQSLEDAVLEDVWYDLYYYDGGQSHLVDSNVVQFVSFAAEGPAVCYTAMEQIESCCIDIQEITPGTTLEELKSTVRQMLAQVSQVTRAARRINRFDLPKPASAIRFNQSGTALCCVEVYTDGYTDGSEAKLYRLSLETENAVPQPVDTDVSLSGLGFLTDDKLLYFKDVRNGSGTLYVNGTKISENVRIQHYALDYTGAVSADVAWPYGVTYSYISAVVPSAASFMVWYLEETDMIVFCTDYGDNTVTLMAWKDGAVAEVAEYVHIGSLSPRQMAEGQLLFLADYDAEADEGELWLYDGKKKTPLDDGVTAIVELTS